MRTTRRIRLQEAGSVRDLGSYPCGEMITAWQYCYRSDILNNLTQEDWKKPQEANVQLILDLHNKTEQIRAPYDSERYGIAWVSLPFMEGEVPLTDSLGRQAQKRFLDSMELGYVDMVRAVLEAVCATLRHIRSTGKTEHTVLFHCTAGKDRTGILAALLLELCGVCNEDILTDCQVSAIYSALDVNRMFPADVMAIPAVCTSFDNIPGTLRPLLTMLDEADCFFHLRSTGIRQDELEELFALLQEP